VLTFDNASIFVGYMDAVDYYAHHDGLSKDYAVCIERREWPKRWEYMNEDEIFDLNRQMLSSVESMAEYLEGRVYFEYVSLSYFAVKYLFELYFCDSLLRSFGGVNEFLDRLTIADSYTVPPFNYVNLEMEGELFGQNKGYVLRTSALEYIMSVIYGFSILQHVGLLTADFCVPYSEEGTPRLAYAVVSALQKLPPDTTGDLRDLIVAELERRVPCDEASIGADE